MCVCLCVRWSCRAVRAAARWCTAADPGSQSAGHDPLRGLEHDQGLTWRTHHSSHQEAGGARMTHRSCFYRRGGQSKETDSTSGVSVLLINLSRNQVSAWAILDTWRSFYYFYITFLTIYKSLKGLLHPNPPPQNQVAHITTLVTQCKFQRSLWVVILLHCLQWNGICVSLGEKKKICV